MLSPCSARPAPAVVIPAPTHAVPNVMDRDRGLRSRRHHHHHQHHQQQQQQFHQQQMQNHQQRQHLIHNNKLLQDFLYGQFPPVAPSRNQISGQNVATMPHLPRTGYRPAPLPHRTSTFSHISASSMELSPTGAGDNMNHHVHRPRSASLGSAGSSLRESCSPSDDSSASRDSLSQDSPGASSPSPESPSTPPEQGGCKLLGILKGTLTNPYQNILNQNRTSSASRDREDRRAIPVKRRMTDSAVPYEQDQPIDLSCKKRRRDTVAECVTERVPSGRTTEASSENNGSILASILNGRTPPEFAVPKTFLSQKSRSLSRSPVRSLESRSKSPACSSHDSTPSPKSETPPPLCAPPSPANSVSSESSTASRASFSGNQRVALAKKNLFPVSARVADWVTKIIELVKTSSGFGSLGDDDQMALLLASWPSLLLLYMAETNFQFAVAAVHPSDAAGDNDVTNLDTPTMQGVEKIQAFIKKCQGLGLDSTEYECIKMTSLYRSSSNGVHDAATVERLNSESRARLQKHCSHDPKRYSTILLTLLTLSGINSAMVEDLFCSHLASKHRDMSHFLLHLFGNHNCSQTAPP